MTSARVPGVGDASDHGATSTSVSRVLTDDEEREIAELFRSTRGSSTEGITTLARALTRELQDTEAAIVHALEASGSVMVSLDECVVEVERALEDVNAWSTVFETKLTNMRGNIKIIKNRSDEIEATTINKQRLLAELRSLLKELELPSDAVAVLEHGQLEDAKDITAVCGAARTLLAFQLKLRQGLPRGVSDMRATHEVLESVSAISQRTLAKIFERFQSITEKWTRASTRERKKSEAKIWYTIHSELSKFEELFQVFAELNTSAMDHFATRYCLCCARVAQHDLEIVMTAMADSATSSIDVRVSDGDLKGTIKSIGEMINAEIEFVIATFKISPENKELYGSKLITNFEESLLKLIDGVCTKDGAYLLPLLAFMDCSSRLLTGFSRSVLISALQGAQAAIDEKTARFVRELIGHLNKVSSKQLSAWNAQGEHDFPMREIDSVRRMINFSQHLNDVHDERFRTSMESSLQALCEVAFDHIENLAAATVKRNDRVRIQGYVSLNKCFAHCESQDGPLMRTSARLNQALAKSSLNYVSVVCEKHFGKFFVELYILLDSNGLGDASCRMQLLKLYKLAVPNMRGFEKTTDAISKTMIRDLVHTELFFRIWVILEEYVIRAFAELESNAQMFATDHTAAVSIEDVRRVFVTVSRAVAKK